jgi:hypothetical protein
VNQHNSVTVTIGKYGIPVNVQIEEETKDQYLLSFHEFNTGHEVTRRWYDKDIVLIHDTGENNGKT